MNLKPVLSVGSLCALVTFGSLTLVSAAVAQPDPAAATADPYTTAVRAYVSAATKEIAAIRAEVVANEKLGRKERYAPVRRVLETCESLVARLKDATRGQFDPIKAEYERNRNELLQKLNIARQG